MVPTGWSGSLRTDRSSSSCSSGDVGEEEDEHAKGHGGVTEDSQESSSEDTGCDDSEWEPDADLEEDDEFGEEGDDDNDDDAEEGEKGEDQLPTGKRKRKNTSGIEDTHEDVGEEELCRKVVAMLQRRKDLSMLNLDGCKAYLRKHGLRLTGSKLVCMQRVQDHWRLKDGNGEMLYPKSSFVINCTGDVCTGDVILFKQRVYDRYDIVTRGGNIIGRRTIAGKVVKESYGAAKQQHTFTVEILWSKGFKPLPALYPLLVKGRNLYRLKTFRQRWDNELERSKVLAEKHRRGAAARHTRAIRKAKTVKRGPKYHQNSRGTRDFLTKWRKKEVKHWSSPEMCEKHLSASCSIARPRALESATIQSVNAHPNTNEVHGNYVLPQSTAFYTRDQPLTESHYMDSGTAFDANRGLLSSSSTHDVGSSSTMNVGWYNQALNRTSFFKHPYSNNFLWSVPHSSSLPPYQGHFEESVKFRTGMQLGRWNGEFHCRTPGCRKLASDGCVSSCCWMCCGRIGGCDIHR